MTIPKVIVLAALFSAITSSSSVAQSPVVAQWKTYVLESCGKEINRFCKNVVAGDGRLLACLYARDKSLSGNCRPQSRRRASGSRGPTPRLSRLNEFASPMRSGCAPEWCQVAAI
jgi:hypothetical protein